jgi:hypothetical protein
LLLNVFLFDSKLALHIVHPITLSAVRGLL